MLTWPNIFILFILAFLLRSFLHSHRLRAKSRTLGCEPPYSVASGPFSVFLAIKAIFRVVHAGWNGQLHIFLRAAFDKASVQTGYRVKTISQRASRLLTYDEANVHAILTTQSHDFNPGTRKESFWPMLGEHSIFGANGQDWKQSRNIIRTALSRTRISDTKVIHDNTAKLIAAFSAAQERTIDVLPLLLEHTMRTSTQFLGLQGPASAPLDQQDFTDAMELCSNGIITRLILGSFYWLYNTRAYRSACTYFRGVVQVSVRGALARTAKASNATTSEPQDAREEQINLLDDLALQTRDEERLTSMASDMLVAGRDTTAALLSGLILHLARDPAAYAKLRIAVLNDFGPRTGDEYMTFEQLKQCQYLQFCMKETLRLSPSVAYGFMTASVDTTLPAGGGPRGDRPIFVVKGTDIVWSFPLLHRDPDFWGEDAEIWRPERFDGRTNTRGYLPFNAGPRTCPGQQFALTSAAYTLVRLCQAFERLEDCNAPGEQRVRLGITNLPFDGNRVRFVPVCG